VTVFTAGVWRPTIYVTEAAERVLSSNALRAALLHERAHVLRHDVRLVAMVAVVSRAIGRLPGVASGLQAVMLRVECGADDYALASGAVRKDLFEAIAASSEASVGPAATLTGVTAEQRLRRLVAPSGAEIRLPRKGIIVSLVALTASPIATHVLVVLGSLSGVHHAGL
jgi:beta-lactamase regulating signal transducer with metallopeptidase domain